MRADRRRLVRAGMQQLSRTRPEALPPQRTFRGWVRAALAFQPAYGQPTGPSAAAADATMRAGHEQAAVSVQA